MIRWWGMERWGGGAGEVSGPGAAVLIRIAGVACTGRTSASQDPRSGARCAAGAEPKLCQAVCQRRPPLGAAGAVAERPVDPGAVWHPLRAATDGATEL